MGAFGELLQKHFGGTKHDVSTWGNVTPKKKATEEIIVNKKVKPIVFMKYIGKKSLGYKGCVKTNDVMQLVSKEKTDNLTHFPSGVMLSFKMSTGGWFGYTDSTDWVEVKR